MTVTYTSQVTSATGIGAFVKLLLRWKASIYKLVWKDLVIFLSLYYAIHFTYQYGLNYTGRKNFEKVVMYCRTYYNLIPLSFVLGFYVTLVMSRWWDQYLSIPFPDNLAILLSATIQKQDDDGRLVRRAIARYACLTFTMTMAMMSPKVKKRFPTLDHFVEAGLMQLDEKKILEDMDLEYPSYSKYWLPIAWACNIVTKARRDGLLTSDQNMKILLKELMLFRSKCGGLLDYDWISIPLVYTQVVTLAVYSYFLTTILAQQFIKNSENIGFPFLSVLEYFFYMGWLKVAESLINPFGEDDDDFEVNWMIDRHVQVSYLIVDKMHHKFPTLIKDQYWQKVAPDHLPHTEASGQYRQENPMPSTFNIHVTKTGAAIRNRNVRGENVDGELRRSGSFISRVFRNKKNKRPNYRIPNPVGVNDHIIGEMDELPSSSSSIRKEFLSNVENFENVDVCDFEALKQARQDLMKKRLKHCINLLKNTVKEDEENQIIEKLIDTSIGDKKRH